MIYYIKRSKRTVGHFVNLLQEQLQRFRSAALARQGGAKMPWMNMGKFWRRWLPGMPNMEQLAREHIENAEQTMLLEKQGLY